MRTFGLRRAMKVYASQVRRQVHREQKHDRLRRIAQLHEAGEVMLRAVRPSQVDPLSVEHLTKLVEELASTGQQTTPKEPLT